MTIYSLNPKQAEKVNDILNRPRGAIRYRSFGAAYIVMPKDAPGRVKVLDRFCTPVGFITVHDVVALQRDIQLFVQDDALGTKGQDPSLR
jgi:hypothetical protein